MSRNVTRHELLQMALDIHREHGEPKGYKGPCWGPTQQDIDEAKRRLAGCRAYVTGFCNCGPGEHSAAGKCRFVRDPARPDWCVLCGLAAADHAQAVTT